MGSRGIKNELWNKSYKVGRKPYPHPDEENGDRKRSNKKPRLSEQHPGPYDLPLSFERAFDHGSQYCLGSRYYLHSHGERILLSCGHHGLGKSEGPFLEALEHPGSLVLYRGLEEAISRYGTPQIFNTDQGSQFTADAFTRILKTHNIRISMDGRGRWMDNVFIERLWKSVKYEDVYLKAYSSITAARTELTKYFDRYNKRRRHQGLDNMTPDEVYWDTIPKLKEAV